MGGLSLAAARKGGAFETPEPLLELTGEARRTGLGMRVERRLAAPLAFEMGAAGSGLILYVPAGYVTDGYSMPGLALQAFQPSSPRYLMPAILHDWLYDAGLVSRAMADLVLLQAMRAVGVPEWQCLPVYLAVRAGGWGGFAKPLPVNLDIVRQARANGVSAALLAHLNQLMKEPAHV
jgi:hypothetical protein